MRLTGERPLEGRTPPGLLALHEAGYREVRTRLGPGRLLDLGCGVGDGTASLRGPGREVVGIDYDVVAAAFANRSRGLTTLCADGARLSVRSGSFDAVCSSHLIEHFVDPEPHVAELARVLADDGVVFVITPNAPADFENPFHVHLFEPRSLKALLDRHFDAVEIVGLDGDDVVKADFERRRRFARRVLALDVFGLRHRLGHRAYVGLHALARRVAYPLLAARDRRRLAGSPRPEIGPDRFSLTPAIDRSTLVLFAIARAPRRVAG